MTWEQELFSVLDDLEQQAEALYDAERAADLADRARSAYGEVTLQSRLMASVDDEVGLDLLGVGRLRGRLQRVGPGWCLLAAPGQDWVVSTAALLAVHDASPRALPEVAWSPVARLGLASALRRLADAGERCVLRLVDGGAHEATLARVGADFVESSGVDGRPVLVPFAALAAVQSRPEPAG